MRLCRRVGRGHNVRMRDDADDASGSPDVPASVRAQLLATEQRRLLATRSANQGEVLTRIGMFLTLTSAGLMSLAEDLAFVLAMNRLRAAYVDLDPGIAPYLMASRFDDFRGSRTTYYFLGRRGPSQLAGSSLVFIIAVNASLLGLLVSAG